MRFFPLVFWVTGRAGEPRQIVSGICATGGGEFTLQRRVAMKFLIAVLLITVWAIGDVSITVTKVDEVCDDTGCHSTTFVEKMVGR